MGRNRKLVEERMRPIMLGELVGSTPTTKEVLDAVSDTESENSDTSTVKKQPFLKAKLMVFVVGVFFLGRMMHSVPRPDITMPNSEAQKRLNVSSTLLKPLPSRRKESALRLGEHALIMAAVLTLEHVLWPALLPRVSTLLPVVLQSMRSS